MSYKEGLNPRALIIGVSGQDGAYLSKLLIDKGYQVFGTSRYLERASLSGLKSLGVDAKVENFKMDPCNFNLVQETLSSIQPHEVYNLSAQSSVSLSFKEPASTIRSIVVATLNILEAIRVLQSDVKFYNAGSGEIFGETSGKPADENTEVRPVSPYGYAKAAAMNQVAMYRNTYGLHACTGILFNHESPLRPETYVTRKIVSTVCRIGAGGSREKLRLGNIDICRDWGYAPEYVVAMWKMLQTDQTQDFVIATGKSNSLRYFVEQAFLHFNLNWKDHVVIDNSLMRPAEIEVGSANPGKAENILGWRASSGLLEVIERMINHELKNNVIKQNSTYT